MRVSCSSEANFVDIVNSTHILPPDLIDIITCFYSSFMTRLVVTDQKINSNDGKNREKRLKRY